MKIVVDYNDNSTVACINVTGASYVDGYKILIQFSDGAAETVDFERFLRRSRHPSIKKYLDKKLFLQFQIVDGNLNWNDYDLIFPVMDLYDGKL